MTNRAFTANDLGAWATNNNWEVIQVAQDEVIAQRAREAGGERIRWAWTGSVWRVTSHTRRRSR